jgi:hypothetical protein
LSKQDSPRTGPGATLNNHPHSTKNSSNSTNHFFNVKGGGGGDKPSNALGGISEYPSSTRMSNMFDGGMNKDNNKLGGYNKDTFKNYI